jgi:hypothetical protein
LALRITGSQQPNQRLLPALFTDTDKGGIRAAFDLPSIQSRACQQTIAEKSMAAISNGEDEQSKPLGSRRHH